MRDTMTLRERIEKEEKKLSALKKQRAELDGKIKSSELALTNFRLRQNDQTFSALKDVAELKGLTVEDIFSALQSGDISSLQARMEAAQEQNDIEELEGTEEESESGDGVE